MRFLSRGLVIHRWCTSRDPAELVPIESGTGAVAQARRETAEAFARMRAAAHQEGVALHVIWGYRSSELQDKQFREAEEKYGRGKGIRWLAPPGYSEHQTGWVLDIGDTNDRAADDNPLFERTAAFRWLCSRAKGFDFELSFPSGNWQGVGYEPWHWRFIGTSEAQRTFHPKGAAALQVWAKSWAEALRHWLG